MNKLTLILLALLTTISPSKQRSYEDLILGDWTYIREDALDSIRYHYSYNGSDSTLVLDEFLSDSWENEVGFILKNNDSCDNKQGFYTYENGNLNYRGTKTIYKMERDTLKIYDPYSNTWEFMKIRSITNDTLELQKDDIYVRKFAKERFLPNNEALFDQFISYCDGNYIMIDKNGDVFYSSGNFDGITNGYYKMQIDNKVFSNIENTFKIIDIFKQKDRYREESSPIFSGSMTFVKDNKIIKSIDNFFCLEETGLNAAYKNLNFRLRYILKKDFVSSPYYLNYQFYCFQNKESIYIISTSQRFYLKNVLSKGNLVTEKPKPLYTLLSHKEDEKVAEIVTDGKLYQFNLKNGEQFVLDIGFDFLEINKTRKQKNYLK